MPDSQTSDHSQNRKRVNSAGRLHALLLQLRNNTAPTLLAAITQVFNVTADNLGEPWAAIKAYSLLREMIEQLEREVVKSGLDDEDRQYCLHPLPEVIRVLFPLALNQGWAEYRRNITDSMMSDLKGAFRVLRLHVGELELQPSDFDAIHASLKAALDTAKEMDLPPDLRDFINIHLLRVQAALNEYKYRGLTGLKDALTGYAAALSVVTNELARKSQTGAPAEQDETTNEKTSPFLASFRKVISDAKDIFVVAQGAVNMYPHLHSGYEYIQHLLMPPP